MSARTRYFVIASLLVLAVGLGTGLVAYYVARPSPAASLSLPELQYVPADAAVLAFVDVRDVMTSELRQYLQGPSAPAQPGGTGGRQEFQNATGIDIENDIDRVVACLDPSVAEGGLVLARGRFDVTRIEALMRDHGAQVEEYAGRRVLTTGTSESSPGQFTVAFAEPGLVAVGTTAVVRKALDVKNVGPNVTSNDEVMRRVKEVGPGNAWAVGRFEALRSQARLPPAVASQIPPIVWFSASGLVNGGVSGLLRAEMRDEESARNLRDVGLGLLALVRLQTSSRPELARLLESLEMGGTGNTVSLSFVVPAQALGALLQNGRPRQRGAEAGQ